MELLSCVSLPQKDAWLIHEGNSEVAETGVIKMYKKLYNQQF